MGEPRVVEVLEHLRDALERRGVAVLRMVLFGSRARGTQGPDSDIDVLILSDSFKEKDTFERAELVRHAVADIVERFVVPLDVVPMTPEEYESGVSLAAQYAREGEVLYRA